jgi:hypothetical protein
VGLQDGPAPWGMFSVVEVWQKRCETSTLGRCTVKWWDDVGKRLESSWIQPAYYVTQLLGRHGDFNAKLREFRSVRSGNCRCGARDASNMFCSTVGGRTGSGRPIMLVGK